jgi:rhamnosyltransferase
MSSDYDVSIVVVSKNGLPFLKESLVAILEQQTHWSFHVLVIDSGSTDGTVEYLRTFCTAEPRVELLEIPPESFHHAATRNWGAHITGGRFVVFLGGDAVPEGPTWLASLIAPVAGGGCDKVAASYGRQLPRRDVTPSNACRMAFNYGPYSLLKDARAALSRRERYFFSSVSCCVSRDLVGEPIFDDTFPVNEDWTLARRLIDGGFRIAYCAESRVVHSHNHTYWDILQRSFDNGVVGAKLGIFAAGDHGIWAEARLYLGGGLRQLRGAGLLTKLHFLIFFVVSGIGVALGLRHARLPRLLRDSLSKYRTA